MNPRDFSGMSPGAYQSVELTYTGAGSDLLSTVIFKDASGDTLATLTFAYDSEDRLQTVTKS